MEMEKSYLRRGCLALISAGIAGSGVEDIREAELEEKECPSYKKTKKRVGYLKVFLGVLGTGMALLEGGVKGPDLDFEIEISRKKREEGV